MKNNQVAKILSEEYGIGALVAPPYAVIWAAEKIENTEQAKAELKELNQYRVKLGFSLVRPEYGSRLF